MSTFPQSNNRSNKKKSYRTELDDINHAFGKIAPQAVDVEEAVIGALMLEKDACSLVTDILTYDTFYKPEHQIIYRAIFKLFQESQPVDIITVVNELRKSGELDEVGGAKIITQLTQRVASTANLETHARILNQKYIQRSLISSSSELIKDAYDEASDAFELLDKAERNLFNIASGTIKKNFARMSDLIAEAKLAIDLASQQQDGLSGVPSGFDELDRMTAGWQKSDLIILAARPGMGKTAFVLSIGRNAAVDFKKPVAIFSLEMSAVQLVTRLIASETELSSEKLKKGKLEQHEWHQLNSKISELSEAPIYIDDTPSLSIFELRAKARRLKNNHDIQMIIIDYLQLMTVGGEISRNGNREQEISTISRALKGLAKELNVPVIALSQLSREVEKRAIKVPQLSDLRESGAIEQDADMVIFIYRPDYYNINEDGEGNPQENIAEIHIAKHRNGSTGNVQLEFIGNLAKFRNIDKVYARSSYNSSGLPANHDFDHAPGEVILGSKMNSDFYSDQGEDGVPF
jgi:replicative DNA helicase